jgi:hypothetical protein
LLLVVQSWTGDVIYMLNLGGRDMQYGKVSAVINQHPDCPLNSPLWILNTATFTLLYSRHFPSLSDSTVALHVITIRAYHYSYYIITKAHRRLDLDQDA